MNFVVLETSKDEKIGKMLESWAGLVSPAFKIEGFPTLVAYDHKGYPTNYNIDRMNLGKEIDMIRTQ